jgi:hypothetical protein
MKKTLILLTIGVALSCAPAVSAQALADSLVIDEPVVDEEASGRKIFETGLIFTNVALSATSLMSRDRWEKARTTTGAFSAAVGVISLGISFSEDTEYPTVVFASGVLSLATGMVALLAPKATPVQVTLSKSVYLRPWIGAGCLGLRVNGAF